MLMNRNGCPLHLQETNAMALLSMEFVETEDMRALDLLLDGTETIVVPKQEHDVEGCNSFVVGGICCVCSL